MPVAAEKTALTDRFLRALKPVAKGERRRTVWDVEPGLAVQVGTKGRPAFFAVRRMPGAKQVTWRKLGEYPDLPLAEAREAARDARTAMRAGQDPKKLAEAKRRAEAEAEQEVADNTFAAVAERFGHWYAASTGKDGKKRRRAADVTAIVARELTKVWKARPITDISEKDISRLISAIVDRGVTEDGKKRETGGPYAARHAFAAARVLFGWAHRPPQRLISTNPTAGIRPEDLHGAPVMRDRVLSEKELPLVWRAAEATTYPYGPLVKLLLLTGARLREIAEASWGEVELDKATLTVTPDRMKMKVGHVIPLRPAALAIVAALPGFEGGGYLFSTTGGRRPISGFSKFRAKFNSTLDAILEKEQRPPLEKPFTLHDLRRTVRTGLASLRVLPVVAEMVIGHVQQGIARVYDLHTYDKEKRTALGKWERYLLGIVAPEPAVAKVRVKRGAGGNVVPLRRRARA